MRYFVLARRHPQMDGGVWSEIGGQVLEMIGSYEDERIEVRVVTGKLAGRTGFVEKEFLDPFCPMNVGPV